MKLFVTAIAISVSVLAFAGSASAAGQGKKTYSPQDCQRMEREYRGLMQKEKSGRLTPAERSRMHEIDGLNNIYCS